MAQNALEKTKIRMIRPGVTSRILQVLALIAFLYSGLSLAAEKSRYRVLGSFKTVARAERDQMRLQQLLDVDIYLLPAEHLGMIRLIVKKDEIAKDTLTRAGIPNWLLVLDKGGEKDLPHVALETGDSEAVVIVDDVIVVDEIVDEKEVDLRVLNPGEGIEEYCRRMSAEPDLPDICHADRLLSVENRQIEVMKHIDELGSFCKKPDLDPAFMRICQEWISSRP